MSSTSLSTDGATALVPRDSPRGRCHSLPESALRNHVNGFRLVRRFFSWRKVKGPLDRIQRDSWSVVTVSFDSRPKILLCLRNGSAPWPDEDPTTTGNQDVYVYIPKESLFVLVDSNDFKVHNSPLLFEFQFLVAYFLHLVVCLSVFIVFCLNLGVFNLYILKSTYFIWLTYTLQKFSSFLDL